VLLEWFDHPFPEYLSHKGLVLLPQTIANLHYAGGCHSSILAIRPLLKATVHHTTLITDTGFFTSQETALFGLIPVLNTVTREFNANTLFRLAAVAILFGAVMSSQSETR
jgi:hypothetical protein